MPPPAPRRSPTAASRARLTCGYSDNGVTVPDNTLLQPAGGVTVMAWVRDSVNPGPKPFDPRQAGSRTNQCGHVSYGLTTGASGGVQFDVTTDHGDLNGGIEETSTSEIGAATLWNGQWHALAGIYDGSTIRLYVDGTLAQSTPVGSSLPLVYDTSDPGLADLFAGQAKSSAGCDKSPFHYGGQIDEIRVYGRALSQTEIQYLQNSTATTPPNLPPPTTTPTAHFLIGQSLKLPGATRFSGLSSRPSSLTGKITDYHWTIAGAATPTVDTDCGPSPVLSHPFTRTGPST